MGCWLLKFATFRSSWAGCLRHGHLEMYGGRSAQGRNALARMQAGEEMLFYHSQQAQAIVGRLRVPARSTADARWLSITLVPVPTLPRPLPQAELRIVPALGLGLLR